MRNRLFGFISAGGELERIERSNQIFFHTYVTLTFFVPFWLVTFKGESNLFLRITWQLAFVLLVMSSVLIRKSIFRFAIWAIPMFALVLSAIVATITRPSSGEHALPLTLITLSVVLYTSSTFKRWAAYGWIAVLLVSEGLLLTFGRLWFASRGVMVNNFPVAIIFHATVGVLIWEAVSRARLNAIILDRALADLVQFKVLVNDRSERNNARRSRLQRIHGEVLNTLIGITNWNAPVTHELIKSCESALANALEIPIVGGGSLRSLVDGCLQKIDHTDFKIRLSAQSDIFLSQSTVESLRAIIEECITNAVKHSRGTLISIGWRISESNEIEIWIEDDGVGLQDFFEDRLGWTEVIYPGVTRLGGRVDRTNLLDSGFRVTIKFPESPGSSGVATAVQELRDTFEEQDNYRDHALGWASLVTALVLLLFTPIIFWGSSYFLSAIVISLLLISYILFLLRFPKLHSFSTNLGASLLACGLLLMADKNISGCENSSGLQWLANIIGLIFLAGLYRFGLKTLFVQFPLFVISCIYVGSHLTSMCVQVLSVPLYGVGVYGIATALHVLANKRRRRVGEEAIQQFSQISTMEMRRREQRLRDDERWRTLLKETEEILEQLLPGSEISPSVRRGAILQDARLRAHLQIEALNQPRLLGVMSRLIDRIIEQDLVPAIEFGEIGEEEIDATEFDFTAPPALINAFTQDLQSLQDRVYLRVDRLQDEIFVASITGISTNHGNCHIELENWRYDSALSRNGEAKIEITVNIGLLSKVESII